MMPLQVLIILTIIKLLKIMENTIENKAKFFAQYWGQEIMKESDNDLNETVYFANTHANQSKISNYYLELKTLSSISDKDAIEVSTIWGSQVYSRILGHSLISRLASGTDTIETQFRNILGVVNYLHSKGYALPFMGISVEQMVEWGWITL